MYLIKSRNYFAKYIEESLIKLNDKILLHLCDNKIKYSDSTVRSLIYSRIEGYLSLTLVLCKAPCEFGGIE
jgi:hypothetical protein